MGSTCGSHVSFGNSPNGLTAPPRELGAVIVPAKCEIQSTGQIVFRPRKTRFWTFQEANVNGEARICPRCGGILLLRDTSKLESLRVPSESLPTDKNSPAEE